MQKVTETRGLRLLALDGGGIRGLSELIILDEIMKRVQHLEKLEHVPKPCDYFDLIGGVGTGGLIVLMLGKLQMPVEDAIKTYVQFTTHVFAQKKHWGTDGSVFKATDFQDTFKGIIESTQRHVNIPMRSELHSSCQSFVVAIPALNMSQPCLFRTYEVEANQSYNCTVWEAARATTAVPELFKRISIGGDLKEEFLGAGLQFNNPVNLVLEEAETLFGPTGKVACVLSIGAGHPGVISWESSGAWGKQLSFDLISVMKQISTDCVATAETFERRCKNVANIYFRFNVEQGMQKASLEDWKKLGDIKTHTTQYLSQIKISSKLDILASALSSCPAHVAIRGFTGLSESKDTKHSFLVPPPISIFLGRQDILKNLEMCFNPGTEKQQQIFVLYGLGGAGKTQLALKFIAQFHTRFSTVYFIDASTVSGIESCFKAIAAKASIEDSTAEDGQLWLAQVHEEWLLVFDNADDPDIDLQAFFPICDHGNIIVTTRNASCCTLAPDDHSQEVGEMNPDEAAELLLRAAGRNTIPSTDPVASHIVKELGYFALAVVQAGAYLKQNKGMGFQTYLDIYTKNRKAFHTKHLKQLRDSYKTPVYTTWDMSHEKLPKIAQSFLLICAFFHHIGLSESIFQNANDGLKEIDDSEKKSDSEGSSLKQSLGFLSNFHNTNGLWDSLKFAEMIQGLTSYSFIQPVGEDRYNIHPLVHSWAKQQGTLEMESNACASACQMLYCASIKIIKSDDYQMSLRLIPHLQHFESVAGDLDIQTSMGFSELYCIAQMWKQGERLQVQVTEARQATLGESHPDTINAMSNLAEIYSNLGRYAEAEQLELQVLVARKAALGESHPKTIIAMGYLAGTYNSLGRYAEAEQLWVQVLDARKAALGESHPDTIVVIGNLAGTYNNLGRYKEAEYLKLQVLKARKAALGESHPETINAMGNLAVTYGNLGRYTEAEQLELQVLVARKAVLGVSHPDTIIAMGNLAKTYNSLGREAEAEQLFLQALDASKVTLGESHPRTIVAMGNLAATYSDLGRYAEAEQLGLQVLEAMKAALGESHPHTMRAMDNLAVMYLESGQNDKAEQLFLLVLRTRRITLEGSHPDTIGTMICLAETYSNLGRYAEAEKLELQVLVTKKATLGESHPDTIWAMSSLAVTYQAMGRNAEAKNLEMQVLEAKKIAT